jgi:hypothetical protein
MWKVEHRQELLRDIAAQHHLDNENYIIRYQTTGECGQCTFEYATVVCNVSSLNTTHTGEVKNTGPSSAGHIRWLPLGDSDLAYCTPENYQTAGQEGREEYTSWLLCTAPYCSEAGRNKNSSTTYCNHLDHTPFWARHIAIRQLRELCFPVLNHSPPNALGSKLTFSNNTTFLQTFEEIWNCRSGRNILGGDPKSSLEFIAGDLQTAAIFSINDRTKLPLEDHLNPAQMMKFFDTTYLDV